MTLCGRISTVVLQCISLSIVPNTLDAPIFGQEELVLEGVYKEGVRAFRADDRSGFKDFSGEIVIKPTFEMAQEFSEGLAAVKLGGKWGYIDHTGKPVIEPRYDEAREFSEGLAAVRIAGRYGYIDGRGNSTNWTTVRVR